MTPDEMHEFLGERYWLQVNRSAATEWKYVARIGLQNLTSEPRSHGLEQAVFAHDTISGAIAGAIAISKERLGK